jgi:hypothetical protein
MPRSSPSRILLLCFAAAVLARLLLQVAAMPPYSGLDELFHVARVAFRLESGREPTDSELALPAYLASSVYESPQGTPPNRPAVLPSFALAGPAWPGMVDRGLTIRGNVPLDTAERRIGFERNYEAQQPSLYYVLAAPIVRILPERTAASELRVLRLFSMLFALITIGATAAIGYRTFGNAGLLAAALLPSLPTWQTLVMRAGNDAIACAAIAVALAISLSDPKSAGGWTLEALMWSIAAAAKLYSWPMVPLLAMIWYAQKASRVRVAIVTIALGITAAFTLLDLSARTSNPLGLFAFDPVRAGQNVASVPIDYATMFKIIVATGIWTSGQHGNALTLAGMAVYALPIVALTIFGLTRGAVPRVPRFLGGTGPGETPTRLATPLLIVACVLFAIAQAINAAAYIRFAKLTGASLPAGGKEGWYWYALAPLFVGFILSRAVAGLRKHGALLVMALTFLVILGDVVIHEGALFRDYAGITSPAHPNALFRWGGDVPFAPLEYARRAPAVSIGPMSGALIPLRLVHLIALLALVASFIRDRPSPSSQTAPQDSTGDERRDHRGRDDHHVANTTNP